MTPPPARKDSPILPPHRRIAAVIGALISAGLGNATPLAA